MGGVFVQKTGKLKIHVMPPFSKVPLTSAAMIKSWLRFFEVSGPFVSGATFVTNDMVRKK